MKDIHEALERLFGVKTRRTLGRQSKESRYLSQPQTPAPQNPASNSSGSWGIQSDLRLLAEIEKYEQVAELMDTKVQSDRGWLKCLLGVGAWQLMCQPAESELSICQQQTQLLCARLYELISHLALEHNQNTATIISMTAAFEVAEKRKVINNPGKIETTESVNYLRWRASTASWSLSLRARAGSIELFLVPASDIMALSQAELPIRLKKRLELKKVEEHFVWTSDSLPVSAEELRVLMRIYFRDLVSATQDQEQPVQSSSAQMPSSDGGRQARSIELLLIERENLAQKVVIQQEEIQKRIARDLHDAVISDVMALKRSLSSDKELSSETLMPSLEGILRKLREICYDLSPRDLSDWGLATVVEDILDQTAQRSGIDCGLNCDIEIPMMPTAVLLHLYRIIQESINNAEKYAEPKRIVVTMEMENERFVVLVADDGKGFDSENPGEKSAKSGGYGMGSLKERADLIRCFYPTKLQINSSPGKGTRVRLEIDLPRFNS
ncbi:MAG: hypothetical protein K2X27_08945 [Candidatus Obscuribacterales bacterium]|nr:hypothetical protein [Candidatus Obscuribacterales bacterium]